GRSPEVVDGDGSHAALLSTALAAYTMPALCRHRRSLRTTRARSEPALLGCANSVGRVRHPSQYERSLSGCRPSPTATICPRVGGAEWSTRSSAWGGAERQLGRGQLPAPEAPARDWQHVP